jgi:hypothetical protein
MPYDVQIIPAEDGQVPFNVLGKSDDTGLMLLQRLYLMMLADQDSSYRSMDTAYSLLRFLEGANQPEDGVMNSILAVCCTVALSMLDESDRELISTFTGISENGVITCTLVLTDGTAVAGAIHA